jgi:signal peptidase II
MPIGVAAAVVAADQITKSYALHHLGGRPHHILGPLDLELTLNSGAAFGIGRGLSPIIVLLGAGLVIAIFWFRPAGTSALAPVASGLVGGGALSNLGDRVFRSNGGAVIDWIHLSHWPTFNVADSCIVVGVGLMILVQLRVPARS